MKHTAIGAGKRKTVIAHLDFCNKVDLSRAISIGTLNYSLHLSSFPIKLTMNNEKILRQEDF
jgi:hypothetical protein